MKKIIAFIACIVICYVNNSYAFAFDNVFFLGDSLSDTGNSIVGEAPIINPGGSMWSTLIAAHYGSNARPVIYGGNNYAFAGAETSVHTVYDEMLGENGVLSELNHLLTMHPHLDSNALYSYWAGANDILDGAGELKPDTLQNIQTALTGLHNAGARYILLLNAPDLGRIPLNMGPFADSQMYTNATISFNQQMLQQTNALGFDVIQVNINALFKEILQNPLRFGFLNTTDFITGCDTACDPSTYVFYNTIHPSAAAHQIIADYVYGVLQGPTFAASLGQLPFSNIQSVNANFKQQMLTFHSQLDPPIGEPNVFFSGGHQSTSGAAISNLANSFQSNNNNNFAFNIDEQISETTLLGGGVSHGMNHFDLGQNTGNYDYNNNTLSLFASTQKYHIFVDAIANVGWNHYSNINRNIPLGISMDTAVGDTRGFQYGVDLTTGYLFDLGAVKTGPMADFDFQHVFVNSYNETGSFASNLSFDSQTRESVQTGLGWQANYLKQMGPITWVGFGDAMGNYQWKNPASQMGAGLISLPGSHFVIPITSPSGLSWSGQVGLTAQFKDDISVTAGYTGIFGQHNYHDHIFNVAFGFVI